MQSLFGTRMTADINLAAQVMLLAGLWGGFILARTKRIPHHANIQTAIVLANLVFIFFAMGTSFYSYVVQGGTGDTVARWMILHGVFGVVAELSGLYLIVRMRTTWLPKRWRVRNFKRLMRATLGLWTILVMLGGIIYVERYLTVDLHFAISEKQGTTAAPILQLVQEGSDLNVHATEMEDAANRGNFATVKRHAEHLVNLIEGAHGLHYGDLDADGVIEDPGDGTGLLNYVQRVADAAQRTPISRQAVSVTASLTVIRDNALRIVEAHDLAAVKGLISETASLARRTDAEGIGNLNAGVQAAGVLPLPYTEPPMPGTMPAATVTVVELNFAFQPSQLTVSVGTTVVWENRERAKHTVTSDDGLFDSGDQNMGHTFQFTFTNPGTYHYYCQFHGDKGGVGMAGTIIVR
jgi:plastocyanin/uncharacterized membrane protein YozB (DUF420 family)